MLTLPIQVGRSYKTRDGSKATVFKTDYRSLMNSDASYCICGIRESLSDSGRVYDKMETWREDGRYSSSPNERHDIVEDWVEPVYQFQPMFLKSFGSVLKTLDDAIDEGGEKATAENPLLGYLRVDIATNEVKLIKTGETA
jgi:hypothetical protein